MNGSVEHIFELPIPDRINLAKDILDSVASDGEAVTLPEAQMAELERRIEYYKLHPNEYSSWEDVKARLLTRK